MVTTIQKASSFPRSVQFACTVAGIAIAFLVQLPLETKGVGDPFTVFIAFVFVSALMFGRPAGWVAVVFSALLSALFFDPIGTFHLKSVFDLAQIQIYALLAIGAVLMADQIHEVILAQATANATLITEGKFKSLQLKEVAHRVANNFSSLDALIRQRAQASNDPKIKLGFEQASELVHIVGRLNNRLGTLGNKDIVESESYLNHVCNDLQACAPANIQVICEADSFKLPLKWAISLGLIINELVTNSFKYAFPGGREGTIRVAFYRNGSFLQLLVEDDGIGMDGKVKGTGMGFPLLQTFSEYLTWTVALRSDATGTSTSILLPYDAERETSTAGPHPTVLH